LGEALGEAHDLAVLDEVVRAERAHLADARACERLLARARARRRVLYLATRPLGRRLFRDRPGAVIASSPSNWASATV
jgi:hypothetical protein